VTLRCPTCGEEVTSTTVEMLTENRLGSVRAIEPMPNPRAEPCGHAVQVVHEYGALHLIAPR
jgi:hypothetical protein